MTRFTSEVPCKWCFAPYGNQCRGVFGKTGFLNSTSTTTTMSSSRSLTSPSGGNVIRSGHLRKLKTLKKKYFVLREEASGCPACLEYYDSKKKFENRQPPKRSISLHSCFNINKRSDTKQKNVIALYTKDECFCLVLDSEKDLGDWLNSMLLLQNGGQPDGEQPRPTFGISFFFNFIIQLAKLVARKLCISLLLKNEMREKLELYGIFFFIREMDGNFKYIIFKVQRS